MNLTYLMNSAFVLNIKSKKDKVIISGLCVWSFLNTFILIRNSSGYSSYNDASTGIKIMFLYGKPLMSNPIEYFYPFKGALNMYDYTEYFVYVGGVWMIYFLYHYLKGSKL